MKIIQGKIVQKGQVVLDNLMCKIQFHTGLGNVKSWAGRFGLPVGQSLSLGDYRLLLENGWSGMISITRVLSEEVHFVGQGPLE
jgi:hypothetical protein